MRRAFVIFIAIFLWAAVGCSDQHTSQDIQPSITNEDFKGKKLFRAWAANMPGDPMDMMLETRYDVGHMHHIFSEKWGGKYQAEFLIDRDQATKTAIVELIRGAKAQLTAEDMYIQYSSGHGSMDGLIPAGAMAGGPDPLSLDTLTYDDIRDEILAIEAKEVVVLMMACHSGGLIESFKKLNQDQLRARYQGRDLYILTSSSHEQTSRTGPGVDPQEPHGVSGSAGSRFGNVLWKALSGEADQDSTGNQDGKVTLEELTAFVIERVRPEHDPQVYGFYDPQLVMTRQVGPIGGGAGGDLQQRFEGLKAQADGIQRTLDGNQQQISNLYQEKNQAMQNLQRTIDASESSAQIRQLEQQQQALQAEEWRLLDEYRRLEAQLGCAPSQPHSGTVLDQLRWSAECDEADRQLLKQKLAQYQQVQQQFQQAFDQELLLLQRIAGEQLLTLERIKTTIDTLSTQNWQLYSDLDEIKAQLFDLALQLLKERLTHP